MKNLLFIFTLVFFFSCAKKETLDPVPVTNTTKTDSTLVTLAKQMNSLVTPITKSILDLTDQDLEPFSELKTAKVIGLGEATHGTKEFFQMKHRLFKYFVENFNHKVFAFEMDYAESLIFDKYIQTGEGDLTQLMKDKMIFWTWNTTEVRALIEWMKNYNVGKPAAEKLHLYGFDCQFYKYNIPALVAAVSKIDATLGSEIAKSLANVDDTQKTFSKDLMVSVLNKVKANKDALISKSSLVEYDIMEHLATIMVQTADVRNNTGESRDKYMGDNALWLSQRTNYPMTIWAHNLHVNTPTDAFDNNNRALGYYMLNNIQDNYKTIGFSFATGSVTAMNTEVTPTLKYNTFPNLDANYSNTLLSMLSTPNYFYKTNNVFNNNQLRIYFSNHSFFQIGAVFNTSNFKLNPNSYYLPTTNKNFDFMIHINTSTHSDNYRVDSSLK